jgi:hypothetical protein
MQKNSLLIVCVAAILAVFYAVSFTPVVRGRNAEGVLSSALMNPKYETSVNDIQITEKNRTIQLFKNEGTQLWQGRDGNTLFPVDNSQVKKFISRLIKVRNMYTISDNQKKWQSLSLTDGDAVCVVYKNSDNMSTKLYFGGWNFDKSRRYFRTDNTITSYEIESDIDVFLSSKESFWYDPYILPRNIPGVSGVQDVQRIRVNGILYTPQSPDFTEKCAKLTELRHGDILSVPGGSVPGYEIEAETGSGLQTTIRVYNAADGKILEYSMKNTLTGTAYDYSYAVMISNWTAGKMEELFPPAYR